MIGLIIVGVIVLIIIIYFIATYNSLVGMKNRVKDEWSQIDVELKRRADLIPNLIETVKGYAKHEKTTFDSVVEARNKMNNSSSKEEEIEANNMITDALNKLFALSEAYPELKANENFNSLQADMRDTEDKIALSRRMYNDTVLTYNNKIEMFPSNVIAKMFKFKQEIFFNAEENEKEVPKAKF